MLSQSTDALEKKRKGTNIHIQNTNFSPFLSVAWSPWADGKTAFKAAAGRYYNNIALVVPLQELQPVLTTVEYRASLADPELCPEPDPDDPNPPDVPCGKTKIVGGIQPLLTVLTVDRNLKTPYQDELTFKIERELWAETALSLTYVNRRFRDQIQDSNINLANGDFGQCKRMFGDYDLSVIASPDTSTTSCSATPIACATDGDCPAGESCGFFFSVGQGASGDWLTDPYTGERYPDTNPGNGDGYLDPITGSTDDNCSGDIELLIADPPCEPGDFFCDGVDLVRRPDAVSDLYLQNPFWGDVFLISNINSIDYEAFVLELVRRQYRSWEMNASYTWSEATGDGEDFFQALGDDPTLTDNEFGFQSYDQTHVVKVNATTITPWGVRLGTAVTWQSGLPYSLLTQRTSYDTQTPATVTFGGEGARTRRTYNTGLRNDERNKAWWNVDLKATREFRLAKNSNLQLSAEIFNLLDDGTYQIQGVQVNGRNTAVRRFGRRWQVGMRLSF